jgi:hypothetical protein
MVILPHPGDQNIDTDFQKCPLPRRSLAREARGVPERQGSVSLEVAIEAEMNGTHTLLDYL